MHMYPGTGTRVCTAAQACRGFGRVPWRVPGYPVGTYPTGGTQTRLPPKVRFAQVGIRRTITAIVPAARTGVFYGAKIVLHTPKCTA
eukprot:3915439-Rhodomonas_salina.3